MTSHLSADDDPTAKTFHVYTSFSSDIDLTDGSQGPKDVCARSVVALTTGVLVVKRLDGTSESITVPFAGFQIAAACKTIESSGDGTTVTAVLVYW